LVVEYAVIGTGLITTQAFLIIKKKDSSESFMVVAHTVQSLQSRLLSVRLPWLLTYPLPDSQENKSEMSLPVQVLASDFVDIDPVLRTDRSLITGVIEFQSALARGDAESALKIVPIRSRSMWTSLASMAVKTKRSDVAKTCLGLACNAPALRVANSNSSSFASGVASSEVDEVALLGTLAEQVGMPRFARDLYSENDRWDLIAQWNAYRGDWSAALDVASGRDRVRMRRAHFDLGRHLQRIGDFNGAALAFAKSDAGVAHISRMLIHDRAELEKYLGANKTLSDDDTEMSKRSRWYAQWLESQGRNEEALPLYVKSGDNVSAVRLLCDSGKLRDARDVADVHPAANYHLAQHYERLGKPKDAVALYAKAKCYAHAIRLAKELCLSDDLMALAMKCDKIPVLRDLALYFENDPQATPAAVSSSPRRNSLRASTAIGGRNQKSANMERAARLYLRSKDLHKALDLAFDYQLFDVVKEIVTAESNPDIKGKNAATLRRCAEFLLSHGQVSQAVDIFCQAGEYIKALNLCAEHGVILNEAWSDQFVATIPSESLNEVLLALADTCVKQGSFDLACKKYTQAGDRTRAVKALIRAGDVEKVIFYAGTAGGRQKEIYVLAANFLQSRDWRSDPTILKHIVTFYSKAKAFDHLASFFESCATIEVDEYSNYEKVRGQAYTLHDDFWFCVCPMIDLMSI
jgi:tetratricopeptide (TPR) repeat protein